MKNYRIKIDFIYKDKVLVLLSLAIFCLTLYILYILKPHQVNYEEQRVSYFFTCLIQSIVPVLLFILGSLIISKSIKKREKEWNIVNEFLFVFILLLGVGLGNFLTRDLVYINEKNWSSQYLFEELSNSFGIGLFIAFIIVLLRIIIELYLNLQKAKTLLNKIKPKNFDPKFSQKNLIQIQGKNKSQEFSINVPKFLYAKSSGNYIDIFLEEEEVVQRITKRISLYSFLNHFSQQENIIRIHKSYVVNLHKIVHVNGNAAGLFLTLSRITESTIPVSRKHLKDFEERVKNMNP